MQFIDDIYKTVCPQVFNAMQSIFFFFSILPEMKKRISLFFVKDIDWRFGRVAFHGIVS